METTNKKGRKRRSVIWTIPSTELQRIISENATYGQVLTCLGFGNKAAGGNFGVLKKRIAEDNIDVSHFDYFTGAARFKLRDRMRIPDDKIFVKDSPYTINGVQLKKRMLKMGIAHTCAVCGLGDQWEGKPISLQIDHINGMRTDNRLENLRIICPNCHSQTPTFSGKRHKIIKYKPPARVKVVKIKPGRRRKVERPDKETLAKMLWETPTTKIGEMYGVSGNAVAKWAKYYNISKPPRGYWAKLEFGKI